MIMKTCAVEKVSSGALNEFERKIYVIVNNMSGK
jgi:hypothetical protein